MADETNEQVFNDAYWAAQPPSVRVLRTTDWDGEGQNPRYTLGSMLSLQGYVIDVPIMVWQWSPFKIMTIRKAQGYTYVPDALAQQVLVAPGISTPGLPPYHIDPNAPPPGYIKVSLDLADYPPWQPKPASGA